MTAPASSVNAFSSSRMAGISLDFASTATWPRTAPIPCVRPRLGAGFLFPVPGAADSLAVDRDYQPAAGLRRPGMKPGANDLVEHIRTDQGERAPERGLLRRAADCSEPSQPGGPGIDGPLADRGDRVAAAGKP